MVPWLLLAPYGILSGVMAGVAPAGLFGVSQALSPRYLTRSSLFWLSYHDAPLRGRECVLHYDGRPMSALASYTLRPRW